jgi:hypothetical protein
MECYEDAVAVACQLFFRQFNEYEAFVDLCRKFKMEPISREEFDVLAAKCKMEHVRLNLDANQWDHLRVVALVKQCYFECIKMVYTKDEKDTFDRGLFLNNRYFIRGKYSIGGTCSFCVFDTFCGKKK